MGEFLSRYAVLLFHFSPRVTWWRVADRVPAADSLAVPLGESGGQAGQELVQGHVGLRGELLGEHGGDHHEQAVGQDLWRENMRDEKGIRKKKSKYMICTAKTSLKSLVNINRTHCKLV